MNSEFNVQCHIWADSLPFIQVFPCFDLSLFSNIAKICLHGKHFKTTLYQLISLSSLLTSNSFDLKHLSLVHVNFCKFACIFNFTKNDMRVDYVSLWIVNLMSNVIYGLIPYLSFRSSHVLIYHIFEYSKSMFTW